MSVSDTSTCFTAIELQPTLSLKMVSVTAFYINRDLKKTTCLLNSWQKAFSYIFKARGKKGKQKKQCQGHPWNTESVETQLLTANCK